MVGNIGNALGAAGIARIPGADDAKSTGAVGTDFSSFVRQAAQDAVGIMESGEQMSMKGIA